MRVATIDDYTRENIEVYAVESQTRTANALAAIIFSDSILPVKDELGRVVLDRDEHMRPAATIEGYQGLHLLLLV